jgi:hypothetical protein
MSLADLMTSCLSRLYCDWNIPPFRLKTNITIFVHLIPLTRETSCDIT